MNIICTPRRSGKTYNLITIAAERHGYIVCCNKERTHQIAKEAADRGLDINPPITFEEFIRGDYYAPGIKEFYIDDADPLLIELARGVPVHTITMTREETE